MFCRHTATPIHLRFAMADFTLQRQHGVVVTEITLPVKLKYSLALYGKFADF